MTKQDTIAPQVGGQAVHKNVYSALCAAQQEMGTLRKGSINPAFKSRYADLADVMDAVLPALNKHGLALFHSMRREGEDTCMVTVLAHGESNTTVECAVPLIVVKNDMQGMKSATTYAKRIGAESVTGIAPEDDDGNAAAKAAPTRTAPAQAMSEGLADAWEDGVLDSLPDHASPRVKAEAFAAAICAGFQGKGHKALDNEWTRRQKWIDGLKGKYPDLYAQVETAYNSRRDQWEAENA
jgi:hypothetical protein